MSNGSAYDYIGTEVLGQEGAGLSADSQKTLVNWCGGPFWTDKCNHCCIAYGGGVGTGITFLQTNSDGTIWHHCPNTPKHGIPTWKVGLGVSWMGGKWGVPCECYFIGSPLSIDNPKHTNPKLTMVADPNYVLVEIPLSGVPILGNGTVTQYSQYMFNLQGMAYSYCPNAFLPYAGDFLGDGGLINRNYKKYLDPNDPNYDAEAAATFLAQYDKTPLRGIALKAYFGDMPDYEAYGVGPDGLGRYMYMQINEWSYPMQEDHNWVYDGPNSYYTGRPMATDQWNPEYWNYWPDNLFPAPPGGGPAATAEDSYMYNAPHATIQRLDGYAEHFDLATIKYDPNA